MRLIDINKLEFYMALWDDTILPRKTAATQNEVTLSYHVLRWPYFLVVDFAVTTKFREKRSSLSEMNCMNKTLLTTFLFQKLEQAVKERDNARAEAKKFQVLMYNTHRNYCPLEEDRAQV